MFEVWFLSQYYQDENGVTFPVAYDYGQWWFCPVLPETADAFTLVRIAMDSHQIDAAKQDPRLVYCGVSDDDPPAQLLEVYANQLDPTKTYTSVGKVVAKLAQSEMNYHKQFK